MNKQQLISEDLLPPEADEVLIRVQAIGLNFADIFALQGLYSATPDGSFIPGLEFAGEVMETGKTVDRIKPGANVMGVTKFGAYADHVVINNDYVVELPEGWSHTDGAAFSVQACAASLMASTSRSRFSSVVYKCGVTRTPFTALLLIATVNILYLS